MGDIGCFSLNDFKHISAGDGGMCLMNDQDLYHMAFRFADKNYDRLSKDPSVMRRVEFLAPNYRMTELQGAVALAQLDKLNWICERRNEFGDGITDGIRGLPGIYPHEVIVGGKCTYWFYMLRLNEQEAGVSRDEFCKALSAEGIPNQPGYIPACVYEYDLLKHKNVYPGGDCPFGCKLYGWEISYQTGLCPVSEEILRTAVRLNVNEFYTRQDLEDVVGGIRKVAGYFSKDDPGEAGVFWNGQKN